MYTSSINKIGVQNIDIAFHKKTPHKIYSLIQSYIYFFTTSIIINYFFLIVKKILDEKISSSAKNKICL